ncbi:MAG: hypothetical protein ACOY93_03400 [Bacillota bacterium]
MAEKKSVNVNRDDVRVDENGNLVIKNPELAKLIRSEKVTEVNEVDAHKVTITWE